MKKIYGIQKGASHEFIDKEESEMKICTMLIQVMFGERESKPKKYGR